MYTLMIDRHEKPAWFVKLQKQINEEARDAQALLWTWYWNDTVEDCKISLTRDGFALKFKSEADMTFYILKNT